MQKFAKQAGILVILVFLWLVYVEAVCFTKLRMANTETDIIPRSRLQSVYQGAAWVNTLADEWKPSNKFSYEAYVGWERRPFQGQTINIDATGVRRSLHSHCDDGRAYTIWMFGGSTVWGAGTPDWLTIPSLLAEKYELAGRNVCVQNYGEKAWVNTQEVIKLILELKKSERKPDLVIFYDGPADVYESYQSGRGGVHQNFDDTKQLFEGHASAGSGNFHYLMDTNTARLLLQQKLQNRMRRSSAKDTDLIARQAIRCYLENVHLVEAIGHEYGFKPLLFWEPTISTGNKHWTAEEEAARESARRQTPGLEEANQAAYALIKTKCQPPVFCIADALDTATGTIYFDEAHVAAEGNRLIAERMYNTIQQQHP